MTGLLLGVPVLGALVLSLTDADLRGSPVHFVALANYAILLDDPRARAAIATTALFALTGAALQVGLGLALALALSAFKKGVQAILAISMLPNIITPVIGALFLKWIFVSRWGLADQIAAAIGIRTPDWLGDASWARAIVVLCESWRAAPFAFVVLYAALQLIDHSLVEAARVDGAGAMPLFRHVLLPALLPAIIVVLAIRVLDGVRLFDLVYVMTDGGPGGATETLSLYAYVIGLRRLDVGLAAAGATLAAALALTIPAFLLLPWRRRTPDE